jgi:hypothetical protein
LKRKIIMGIFSFDDERSSKVAPARLFKALVTDNHNLVPKIAPHFIKSAAIIEGDGGAGSIIHLILADDAPIPYLKYKIDIIDEAQFIGKYTIIEGGDLNETVKSISFETKLEATADGGSRGTLKMIFTIADGAELSEQVLEGHKARAKKLFDGVEGYLLANPDVYA